MNVRHIALVLAGGAAALTGAYFVTRGNAEPVATADRAQIETIVREYLMEHPEVIIDAVNKYAEQQREAEAGQLVSGAQARFDRLLDPSDGYVAGADVANAKVAVVEFFDYHCPYCKKANDTVHKLADDDKDVKVVYREFPILRPESELAAKAALAAREQGKYRELHYAMMGSSGVLTQKRIDEIAKKQGLDLDKLHKDMKSPKVAKAIDETHKLASEIGVSGTPAFVIGSVDGQHIDVVGGWDPNHVKDAIKAAKKAYKGAAAPAGAGGR